MECEKSEGTFYVFPDISSTKLDFLEFSKRLLEEFGVATVPGIAFGHDDCVRISFVGDENDLKESLECIILFIKAI